MINLASFSTSKSNKLINKRLFQSLSSSICYTHAKGKDYFGKDIERKESQSIVFIYSIASLIFLEILEKCDLALNSNQSKCIYALCIAELQTQQVSAHLIVVFHRFEHYFVKSPISSSTDRNIKCLRLICHIAKSFYKLC